MLMRATDSLFRGGRRVYPERWLVKELSEVTPGVAGKPGAVCGVLGERLSISSGQRKARPRARGSTICGQNRRFTGSGRTLHTLNDLPFNFCRYVRAPERSLIVIHSHARYSLMFGCQLSFCCLTASVFAASWPGRLFSTD